jgi:hypothetical protein
MAESTTETKCECDEDAVVEPYRLSLYDKITERPFANHAAGECKCTNELTLYRRLDGSEKWLCSCCCIFTDIQISEAAPARIVKEPAS